MKIKNPFKRNKQLKQLQSLSATFAILDELERRGILHYHREKKSLPTGEGGGGALLIEESLATLKLAEGAEGFKHFLEQVAQWQIFKLLQEAYEAHRIDIEAGAVRKAKALLLREGRGGSLTKADIQRIRQNARENMSEINISTLPSLLTGGAGGGSEFDIFIIRATAPSSAQATEANGQLLALGHYDGTKLEMALWEDIKHNLQKEE